MQLQARFRGRCPSRRAVDSTCAEVLSSLKTTSLPLRTAQSNIKMCAYWTSKYVCIIFCLAQYSNAPSYYRVVAGAVRLISPGSVHYVTRITSNDAWDPNTNNNDISVWKINPAFVFNTDTKAVALPNQGTISPAGTVMTVSGWGTVSVSSHFYEIFLPISFDLFFLSLEDQHLTSSLRPTCPLLISPSAMITTASSVASPQIRSVPGVKTVVSIRARATLAAPSTGMLSSVGLSHGAMVAPTLATLESTLRFQPTASGSNLTLEFELRNLVKWRTFFCDTASMGVSKFITI